MRDLPHGSDVAGYRIESIVGRGGMGVVYRATDLLLERPVALKLISDEFAHDETFRNRFKRESRLAASIRHPHVITVFRAGEHDGRLFIAMEYIEGTDLKALIEREGRLSPQLAARLISQVAAALDAAHAKALVHRDVKPANALVAGSPDSYHAYLTDFGLTKTSHSQTAMTRSGTFVGTLDYMAPEQIAGGRVDARADVYSLGCVLYQALAGCVPYQKDSDVAKMYAHSHEPPPSVCEVAEDIAPDFDVIVGRALAKEPAERYPSAGDLGRAALAAAAGVPVAENERTVAAGAAAPQGSRADGARLADASTREAPAPDSGGAEAPQSAAEPRGGARRKRVRWLLATAVAVLVVIAAVALIVQGRDDRAQPMSKDEYQDRLLDAGLPFGEQEEALGDRLPSHVTTAQGQSRAAKVLTRFRNTTDKLIATMQATTPPDDVKDLHRRAIAGFKRVRESIALGAAAAALGNNRAYQKLPTQIKARIARLEALGPEFDSRGYDRLGLAAPGR